MTTFRSKRVVSRSSLRLIHADCNEPDAIGIEVMLDDQEILSAYFEIDGRRSICFGAGDDIEFDAAEFKELIDHVYRELEAWDAALREAGGVWDAENPLNREAD